MRVILDPHHPSQVIGGCVQYCKTLKGFLEIMKEHPEDTFIIKYIKERRIIMEKVNINFVTIQHATRGIENVPVWDSLQSFNRHINSIAQQDDCQMYFPLEARINFHNPDGTFKELYLVRLTHPVEIIK